MKTIREWLNELPEPYRTQALNNTTKYNLDKEKKSLSDALLGAFFWFDSPEHFSYWGNLHDKIIFKVENHFDTQSTFEALNQRAILWAEQKGILEHGTDIGQAKKTVEESEELFSATIDGNTELQADAIGDILVCVSIMAFRLNLNPLDCFNDALKIIEARTGKMKDGQFVKDK